MVYFEDNEVLIRDMIQSDAPIITNEETIYLTNPNLTEGIPYGVF